MIFVGGGDPPLTNDSPFSGCHEVWYFKDRLMPCMIGIGRDYRGELLVSVVYIGIGIRNWEQQRAAERQIRSEFRLLCYPNMITVKYGRK